MARRLNTHVHYRGQVYGPESVVPDDVAGKITNPKVWTDEEATGKDAGGASTQTRPRAGAPTGATAHKKA